MRSIYWDSIKEGQILFEKVSNAITTIQIAKFAGAFEDYGPLHLDNEFASTLGYRGVFAHEMLTFSVANDSLQSFAENMRIVSISQTFHKLVRPSDLLKTIAIVQKKEKSDDEYKAHIELIVENHRHDVVTRGEAHCVLWKSAAEHSKKRSLLPPVSNATKKLINSACSNAIAPTATIAVTQRPTRPKKT